MKKLFLLFAFIISFAQLALAAETPVSGDYRTRNSGNWNGTLTWQVRNLTSWSNTSTPPPSTANIFVQNNHTLTVNLATVTCNNLHINSTGVVAIGANTLQVNGKLRGYYTTAAIVTTGTDGTFYSGQANYTSLPSTALTSTQGSGKLSITGNTRSFIVTSEFGGTTTEYDLDVSLNAAQTATVNTNLTARSISVTTGTLNMSNNILSPNAGVANSGTLTIQTGGTLTTGGVISRTTTANTAFASFVINGNGYFKTSRTASMWPSTTPLTLSASSTIEFSSSSTVTIPAGTYANLVVACTNTSLSSGVIVNSKLTMANLAAFVVSGIKVSYGAGATLEIAGSNVIDDESTFWPATNGPANVIINASLVRMTATGGRTITGTLTLQTGQLALTTSIIMADGSTIIRNSGLATISAAPVFGTLSTHRVNVIINGTMNSDNELKGTTGKVGTLTINGSYTLTAASQADNLAIPTGSNLIDAGYTLTLLGNITGEGTHSGGGKILMTGVNKTVSGATVGNLELNSAGNISLSGNTNITGVLRITAGNLMIASNTLTLNNLVAGSVNSIYSTSASSLIFSGAGFVYTMPANVTVLKNLTILGTNDCELYTNLTIVDGTVSLTGTLSLLNSNLLQSGTSTLTGAGKITLYGNKLVQLPGFAVDTFVGQYSFSGSSLQTIPSGTYYSIKTNNSAGVTLNGNRIVTLGTVTLTKSLSVGTGSLEVTNPFAGNLANISTTSSSSLIVSGEAAAKITIPSAITVLKTLKVSKATGCELSNNLSIADSVNVTGILTLGAYNLTQQNGSSAKLIGNGTIQLTGSLDTQIGSYSFDTFGAANGTGTYHFNGTFPQVISSGFYSSLYFSNTSGVSLGGDVYVTGDINLSSGYGPLTIGANTLTIYNSIKGAGASTLFITNSTSSLDIGGFDNKIHIPQCVSELNNLRIFNNQLVTVDGPVTIHGTLTLEANAGFLNLGSNLMTIGSGTSKTGEIVRNGGAIRGTIKRWFSPSIAVDKIFPLDNGFGAYSEAKLSFTSAPVTGGTLTATFHNSGSGSLPYQENGFYIPAPEIHINLVNIAPQYWTITAGDGLSGGIYTLDLLGSAIPNVIDINYITIIKRTDGSSPWTWSYANYEPTEGTNEIPVLCYKNGTSFSDFGVAGNADNPLPVELTSFTSTVKNRSVTLNWTTSNEQNNSGFDIERKTEGMDYIKMAFVKGNGASGTERDYTYTDDKLTTGKYFYRLKQIDYNGSFKYYDLANEIVIGTPKKYALNQNYPNPFNPVTTISYELPEAKFVSLKIYDMMGREVSNLLNENQEAGYYSVKFDASKLSSGIYFYRINAGDFVSIKKLMLVK